MEKVCGNCEFFQENEAAFGYCVRYPPRLYMIPKGESGGEDAEHWWPIVDAEDRCGEWKPLNSETAVNS